MKTLWSFSYLGRISFLRKLTVFFFSCWFWSGRVIKIRRGPNKGFKWVCCKEHQFWMPLGRFEEETSNWLKSQLKPGMTFIDIGANAGYFTLLGSRAVRTGKVIAFEPVPINFETIKGHLKTNRINNTKVESYAISDKKGEVKFIIEENNPNSHLEDIELSHASAQSSKFYYA